ncbi:DNA polymerase IV [Halovenus rubra]|uniref:DNA polymerase IV n=2 Tax=Halovenus rubra TaxID=869890 RepID=A0ABD5X7E6_9EURY|nr:DNA polymerase IV [Halovenus rubra]
MGRLSRLPGTEGGEDLICHVDMDCFYAACERLREPALRGQPVVVGMGYEPGNDIGAVATASYEAREYGVESAQAISEALKQLPRKREAAKDAELSVSEAGFYRPVDMPFYESVATEVKEILETKAAVVREVSIDEAYLDITDRTGWEEVEEFCRALKDEIATAVGVTASIGVAPTMSASKVASDHDKPDGLVIVRPGNVAEFFAPLDVEAVHGIGPVTAEQLRQEGIETAGDVAQADPVTLESWFGERGRRIYRFSRGEDDRSVEPRGKPKSFSRESAFAQATADINKQQERIQTLATAVAGRASGRDVLYQTISVKVVTPPFNVQTRAQSLPGPVADAELVERVAKDLFEEFEGERVRKLGVRVANLSFTEETQSQLGEWEEKTDSDSSPDPNRRSGQHSLTEYE